MTATGMITTVFGFSVYLNRIAFGDTELGTTLVMSKNESTGKLFPGHLSQ